MNEEKGPVTRVHGTTCELTFAHTAHFCGNHLGGCRPCGDEAGRCDQCQEEYERLRSTPVGPAQQLYDRTVGILDTQSRGVVGLKDLDEALEDLAEHHEDPIVRVVALLMHHVLYDANQIGRVDLVNDEVEIW